MLGSNVQRYRGQFNDSDGCRGTMVCSWDGKERDSVGEQKAMDTAVARLDSVSDMVQADRANALHPWGRLHPDTDSSFIISGDGVHVTDSVGRRLLDGIAGLWCVNIGYGRREMAEAISAQALKLPFYSAFMETGNAPATELAAKLAAAAPGDLNRVFMTTGGSTANDSAIRFLHLLSNRTGRPAKKHLITRADAYHGSTFLTASCSGKFSDRLDLDVLETHIHHLSSVNPYRRPDGLTIAGFCDERVEELRLKIETLGPENVAGFIAEPILASGGVIVPPPGYHAKTLAVCRKYDVKYISDEVVTGFGRLGHLFASEAVFGITPDIITCAKGLTSGYIPLGAMILSDALCEEADQDRDTVFSHGFTYSAHPVACAAALTNMAIFEREGLCGHVRELSPYFQTQFGSLSDLPIVGEVRGMGLLAGVEFVEDKNSRRSFAAERTIGKRIALACRARGVMVRPFGDMVLVSPPLTISHDDVDTMVQALRDSIIEATDSLTREGKHII
jgi:putrescine aminotransferase